MDPLHDYKRRWFLNNRELCMKRLAVWRRANRDKVRNYTKRYSLRHPERRCEQRNNYTRLLRAELLAAYGNKCACCAETEPRFLTLEHKNHDGKQHRIKRGSGVYLDLRRQHYPKDNYTLLCMNCNWATRNKQLCPHVVVRSEVSLPPQR